MSNPLFSPVLKDRTYLKGDIALKDLSSASKWAQNQYKSDLEVNAQTAALLSPTSENTDNVPGITDSSVIEINSLQK